MQNAIRIGIFESNTCISIMLLLSVHMQYFLLSGLNIGKTLKLAGVGYLCLATEVLHDTLRWINSELIFKKRKI